MAKVTFCREYFTAAFPAIDISSYSDLALASLWEMAVMYVGDDDTNSLAPYNPDRGVNERRLLLYLVMAHLLKMQGQSDGQGGSAGLSGRVNSATEGSVSVSVELYKADSLNAQWWSQTNEGLQYWMLTAKYRLGGRLYAYKEPHPWG